MIQVYIFISDYLQSFLSQVHKNHLQVKFNLHFTKHSVNAFMNKAQG